MSIVKDIADALIDELAALDLDGAVYAVNPRYDREKDFPEGEIKATVIPLGVTHDPDARGIVTTEVRLGIMLQQAANATNNEIPDELIAQADAAGLYLVGIGLKLEDAQTLAQCVKIEQDPFLLPEHLEQMNLATASLIVTFRVMRQRTTPAQGG